MKSSLLRTTIRLAIGLALAAVFRLNLAGSEDQVQMRRILSKESRKEALGSLDQLFSPTRLVLPDQLRNPFELAKSPLVGPTEPEPPEPPTPVVISYDEILSGAAEQLGASGSVVMGSSGRRLLQTRLGVLEVGDQVVVRLGENEHKVKVEEIELGGYALRVNDSTLRRSFLDTKGVVEWSREAR